MYSVSLRQGALKLQRKLRDCRAVRCMASRFFAWACVSCILLGAVFWQTAYAEPGEKNLASQWVHMPSGARAAYIGIHGGTVPVSLLASRDGTHMVALVGQTGNDFLRTLKVGPGTRGTLPPAHSGALSAPDKRLADATNPDLLTASAPALPPLRLTANATLLMAGTAIGAMPVIYATGHSFASLNQLYTDSLLFGISENSPLLEGTVKAPLRAATKAAAKRRPLVRGSSASIISQ